MALLLRMSECNSYSDAGICFNKDCSIIPPSLASFSLKILCEYRPWFSHFAKCMEIKILDTIKMVLVHWSDIKDCV